MRPRKKDSLRLRSVSLRCDHLVTVCSSRHVLRYDVVSGAQLGYCLRKAEYIEALNAREHFGTMPKIYKRPLYLIVRA